MTRLTLTIILLVFSGCSGGTKDRTNAEETRVKKEFKPDELVAALKPGMSEQEAEDIIERLLPYELMWKSRWSPFEGLARYAIGNDSTLVISYEEDQLKKFEVLGFDDLRQDVEDDLFESIRLIHEATFVEEMYDPISVIRAINGLLPLGKEKSLAALHEYHRLTTSNLERAWRYDLNEQRIFLVARLLFVRKDGKPDMPWMFIGGSWGAPVRQGNQDWPLFPLAVVDDVPFSLSSGYELAGRAESPLNHLKYCEENCVLRKMPLTPIGNPLKAAASLMSSNRWKRLFPNSDKTQKEQYVVAPLIRTQAVICVKHLLNNQYLDFHDKLSRLAVGQDKADEFWQQLLVDFDGRQIHWNAENNQFEEK